MPVLSPVLVSLVSEPALEHTLEMTLTAIEAIAISGEQDG